MKSNKNKELIRHSHTYMDTIIIVLKAAGTDIVTKHLNSKKKKNEFIFLTGYNHKYYTKNHTINFLSKQNIQMRPQGPAH